MFVRFINPMAGVNTSCSYVVFMTEGETKYLFVIYTNPMAGVNTSCFMWYYDGEENEVFVRYLY